MISLPRGVAGYLAPHPDVEIEPVVRSTPCLRRLHRVDPQARQSMTGFPRRAVRSKTHDIESISLPSKNRFSEARGAFAVFVVLISTLCVSKPARSSRSEPVLFSDFSGAAGAAGSHLVR